MHATCVLTPQDAPVKCSACAKSEYKQERDQVFPTADTLWAHIATVHSLWIPFECILCPFTLLPTENTLKQHYEQTHPGRMPKAIYTYVEKKKLEIERIFVESQKMLKDSHGEKVETSTTQQCRETETESRNLQQPLEDTPPPTLYPFISVSGSESQRLFSSTRERSASGARPTTMECDQEIKRKQTAQDVAMPLPIISISDSEEEEEEEEEEFALDIEKEEAKLNGQTSEKNQKKRRMDEENQIDRQIGETILRKPKDQTKTKRPSSTRKAVWCNLCSKLTTTGNNTGYHIWQYHMGNSKRFSCKTCSYNTPSSNRMRVHGRVTHRLLVGIWWNDQTAELQPEFVRQYKAAFGSIHHRYRNKPMSPIKASGRLCRLCDRTVFDRYSAHLWRFHMSKKQFSCRMCDYDCCELREVKKHLHASGHGNPDYDSDWTNSTLALSDEFGKVYAEAFGGGKEKDAKEDTRC